jgi:acyl-CoA synthetase (NDP forming)
MARAWAAMMDPDLALTLLIVDFPRADRCSAADWDCAVEAALQARAETGANVAMVSTLPELMPEATAQRLLDGGVVPISGLTEAIEAAAAAKAPQSFCAPEPILLPTAEVAARLVPEAEAKSALAAYGLPTPKVEMANGAEEAGKAAARIGGAVALKGVGIAHKTEAGAVRLNLATPAEVVAAAKAMPVQEFLIEEMIPGAVAEVLIGVVKDPAHGFVLTLAAGGILTEVLADAATLLIPAPDAAVEAALTSLRIAPLLAGYRGAPAADMAAIVGAVRAVQNYVVANADGLDEVEINPLLCLPDRAVAVDALLRRAQ